MKSITFYLKNTKGFVFSMELDLSIVFILFYRTTPSLFSFHRDFHSILLYYCWNVRGRALFSAWLFLSAKKEKRRRGKKKRKGEGKKKEKRKREKKRKEGGKKKGRGKGWSRLKGWHDPSGVYYKDNRRFFHLA